MDAVNHPPHYTSHPSGIECIDVTERLDFCAGNAVKYLWRADDKGRRGEDIKKAIWYLERYINNFAINAHYQMGRDDTMLARYAERLLQHGGWNSAPICNIIMAAVNGYGPGIQTAIHQCHMIINHPTEKYDGPRAQLS